MYSGESRSADRRDSPLVHLLFGVGFVALFLGVGAALVVESVAVTLGLWPTTGHAGIDLLWGHVLLALGSAIAYGHLDWYRHRSTHAF